MSQPTIIEAVADRHLFGGLHAFRDLTSWRRWLVFLAGWYGLPLRHLRDVAGVPPEEAEAIWRQHTGRSRYAPPEQGYTEAFAICGRQSGKDRIGALVQAYEGAFAQPEPDGTEIYSLSIAQDGRSALRTQLRYSRAPFETIPLLQQLVERERADALELSTGVVLASYPCRPQAIRGLRCRAIVCSELAFFETTEGNPVDTEMLRAARPALSMTGGRLMVVSSPDRSSGALYEADRQHFGRDDSDTLIWRASAPEMNPLLPADYLRRMERDDPAAFRSEVLGEFRTGVAQLFDVEALLECVDTGVREREPQAALRGKYHAFVDAASGTGKDAFSCGVAHAEGDDVVLDALRIWKPPFNPGGVIAECGDLLKRYHCYTVTGDRYAPGFVSEHFALQHLKYQASERDRSALYMELLPLVNAGSVRLLDHEELLRELRGLERRRGSAGRDRVDHRPNAHDDAANAAAGACVVAAARRRRSTSLTW